MQMQCNNDIINTNRVIESNKASLGIHEYAIRQTTLEQIFINFARAGEMRRMKKYRSENHPVLKHQHSRISINGVLHVTMDTMQ